MAWIYYLRCSAKSASKWIDLFAQYHFYPMRFAIGLRVDEVAREGFAVEGKGADAVGGAVGVFNGDFIEAAAEAARDFV